MAPALKFSVLTSSSIVTSSGSDDSCSSRTSRIKSQPVVSNNVLTKEITNNTLYKCLISFFPPFPFKNKKSPICCAILTTDKGSRLINDHVMNFLDLFFGDNVIINATNHG